MFDLVERIRQTSIRFHRDDDKPARRELEAILDSMSISRDRADRARLQLFLASRQHRRGPEQHPPDARADRAGGRAAAGHAGADAGACARRPAFSAADLRRFFDSALVSPVLTAHPTEVRRKSTIDREMEIAALLDRRERVQLTPEEAAASDEQLRRAVLTLWQTNLLRRTKLTVLDEVANGLSFYDYTFLREVPRLHCALEDRLERGRRRGARRTGLVPARWEAGSAATATAIPFVTADVMRGTLRLQCEPGAALLSRRTARARRRAVAGRASRRRLRGSARARRALAGHARRIAAASRIGWRYPASMRGSTATAREARGGNHARSRSARPRLMPMRRSSRPISTSSIAR